MLNYVDTIIKKYPHQNIYSSTLYIVPTPIGNLADITLRALDVLQRVDLIAAEDTRHTKSLLNFFKINTRLCSLHNYNELKKIEYFLSKLQSGLSIALVSDAGTPIINDPGYKLVRSSRAAGIKVVPLPGACAAITALSAAGLPANNFCYEGFLPVRHKERLHYLQQLSQEKRTIIWYISKHIILDSLNDLVTVLGPLRHVVFARELTKIWENIYGTTLGKLVNWVKKEHYRQLGEIILIVEGYHDNKYLLSPQVLHTLNLLMNEVSIKKAAMLTAIIHGSKKNLLYRYIIKQRKNIIK